MTIAPWPSSSVLIQPLYICSRQFAVVRRRAFCVGRTRIYYSTVFRPVRRVPPILLRQCCDGWNKRGVGNGFWLGTDARHGFAHASLIDAFRTAEAPYRISDQRCIGLAVRVAPSGVKTWDLAYRIRGSGKVRRVSLGRVADVRLEKARERANELTSAARRAAT